MVLGPDVAVLIGVSTSSAQVRRFDARGEGGAAFHVAGDAGAREAVLLNLLEAGINEVKTLHRDRAGGRDAQEG